MNITTEADERSHLEFIKERLTYNIAYAERAAHQYAADVKEIKSYLWENRDAMDRMEKNSVRESITGSAVTGEAVVRKRERLMRLKDSPWFGRIDFRAEGSEDAEPVYIGIHAFYDGEQNTLYIHDWRAPLSGLFYDSETGEASYETPGGTIRGLILLKRQYRIRGGKLEFMLESALSIHDDILQKELSRTSDIRMQNIVATIQREQNAVIRDESAHTLIIQGAAGSGKTSVALHRIAFLLYRFKESITAEELLILSPNKVFSDYIANVLPELGEEQIPETTPEELAARLLDHKYNFQTAWDQAEHMALKPDKGFVERVRFKTSAEIVSKLEAFAVHLENTCFAATDIFLNKYPIPAWFLEERFKAHQRVPVLKRVNSLVRDISSNVLFYYKQELTAPERAVFAKAVGAMFTHTNLRALYKQFWEWLEEPHLLKYGKGSTYEWADVYPLIYLRLLLEGLPVQHAVKHLIIDEMQDYCPIQYAVLNRLFPCKKTILGDQHQTLNPEGRITSDRIARLFPNSVQIRLTRSYRSTTEIVNFTRTIIPAADSEPVIRHGETPVLHRFTTSAEEIAFIGQTITTFQTSDYNSLGIIVKHQSASDQLVQLLSGKGFRVGQLTRDSLLFTRGVVVATPHLVKGLEFDQVLIPQCTKANYHSEVDRHLLYISATRAMHKLDLCGHGKMSKLFGSEMIW
jgi:DNA helicase II / ATP-dependent DNA helicase PcrA